MKKVLALLIVVALAGIWLLYGPKLESVTTTPQAASSSASKKTEAAATNTSQTEAKGSTTTANAAKEATDEDASFSFDQIVAANEKYESANAALVALKKGAVDYDDWILQEFVELGNCAWCDDLYALVKTQIAENKDYDEVGYFAEVLAISNKLENVQTLVAEIEKATDEDKKDVLAEGLELAIGDDNIVNYLAGYTGHEDELLQEAAIAALSNQGSHLAAKYLYDLAVQNKNPDGFYELGIGLGEMIPDDEAFSFLQEAAMKRDEYSHLAVKALVNSGLPGLAIVVDVMTTSTNPDLEKHMLNDAFDHVAYDEETENYLKKLVGKTKVEHIKVWAEKLLKEFELEEDYEEEDDEDEDES